MRVYLLVLDGLVPGDAIDMITDKIRAQKVGWWHHFDQVWVVADQKNRNAKFWRDLAVGAACIMDASLSPTLLVVETKRGNYAVRAPAKSFEWLKKNLGRSSDEE